MRSRKGSIVFPSEQTYIMLRPEESYIASSSTDDYIDPLLQKTAIEIFSQARLHCEYIVVTF